MEFYVLKNNQTQKYLAQQANQFFEVDNLETSGIIQFHNPYYTDELENLLGNEKFPYQPSDFDWCRVKVSLNVIDTFPVSC